MTSLAALRVLDLSEGVAGAFCTRLLAGFGAEVIKIERPGAGDPLRRHGPFPEDLPHGEKGALFLYLGAGKKSITLDIAQRTGALILRRLVEEAEVVVEDLAPGHLAEVRLGYASLAGIKPRLVMTSVTAFGQRGPYAGYKATNLTAFAMGGQMAVTGDPDREPLKNGGYQADYQAGLHAFAATVVASLSADATEVGQHIDIAAMECLATALEPHVSAWAYLKQDTGRRQGNAESALDGLYPCRDGHLGVHCLPDDWPALARALGREDLLADERFRDGSSRLQHGAELESIIAGWAAAQERKAAYQRAGDLRAPIAFVHTVRDLLEAPHLRARGFFREVDHPAAGRLTHPGPPFRPEAMPWQAARAPLLGEHNEDVYCGELGMSREELAVLRASGVI